MKPFLLAIALVLSPIQAHAATINSVATALDMTAQTVTFHLEWDSAPDFYTLDSGGRPKDAFRFDIFNDSRQPSLLNADVQLIEHIGVLYTRWPDTAFSVPFIVNGNVVDFIAPFAALKEADGFFTYLLTEYTFGGTDRVAIAGEQFRRGFSTDKVDPFAVPIPAALPLFGIGLGLIGSLTWIRRRRHVSLRKTSLQAIGG
jgi:hypothetical protein